MMDYISNLDGSMNISPQCLAFNRGFWAKLERYARELAKKNGVLHVCTGGTISEMKQTARDM